MWKRVLKMLVGLYLPLLALSLFLYSSQKEKQIKTLSENQKRETTIKKNNFKEQSYSFLHDTHYWSTLNYPKEFDPLGKHEEFMYRYIELVKAITDYDQFRFLDLNGKEFFRAVRVAGDSVVIGNLQAKQEHAYVKAGLALKRDQLYLSQISLNRENGIIEKPNKPVIRTVAPIFDVENNQIGLVVINFKMKSSLDVLKSKVADTNVYLLDEDHRIISSSTNLEDLPYEFGDTNSTLAGILDPNINTYMRDSTFVDNNHIWSQQPIILNGTTHTFGSKSNKSSKIITPSNWLLVLEIPPRLIRASLLPVSESILTFNIISIIVLFGFSYVYQKNKIQKEEFYGELESKNLLLKKSKDQLQKNNLVVTEINNCLEIRNKQLSDFNYLISHNLRAPVTSMSVIVEMIRNEKEPEKLNQLLPKLDQVTKSITHLTEDINEYVAILDNTQINVTEIDFLELIQEVENEFTETLLDDSTFEVLVDFKAWRKLTYSKLYLQSILHNFISNAIKYKRENVSSFIQFESAYENNKKVLYVKDNGIGLNLERHGENLFKLYTRFHRNISGKGMGLFLVKSQLEALNATITVDSNVGIGTTFKIIFEK
ncbi:sensor histidine kinase [Maribacter sp. ACAM166]|uniref:sensor histidine kinase n=1 Tax=Maribacter sp. ACAM166 TaxID=2508996 RepID=UPI0010FE4BFD|nr:ATP-binding protein [Maribacter sp. ACAM166]TLP76792.1 sensor histidine kinase [Maribacter sp. ACAM166]